MYVGRFVAKSINRTSNQKTSKRFNLELAETDGLRLVHGKRQLTNTRARMHTWSRVSPRATTTPSPPRPATTALESPALATHTLGPLTRATTAVQPPKTALIPDLGREELMSRNTSSNALGGVGGHVE